LGIEFPEKHNNCLDNQDSCCTLCWAAFLQRLDDDIKTEALSVKSNVER
jgi:uncharacterized protein YycO